MFEMPIAISLSPNTEVDDVRTALKVIVAPWKWKKSSGLNKVNEWFCRYFNVKQAYFFNSGRSALYAILKTLDISNGDEVIMQAFTCVAVSGPILWVGAKAVYADIDDSLNIDPTLLEKDITPKTKAVIVQHTFGIPARIDKIKEITQKHNLVLIEDCAHSLGAVYHGQKVGSFGDAAFFSFGRDKIVSSVYGGAVIVNQKSLRQSSEQTKINRMKIKDFQKRLLHPSYFWIFQQLLHPLAFAIILPLYNFFIGKLILYILLKLNLLSKPIYKEEYSGKRPGNFPQKYPPALEELLLNQLNKLEYLNAKRKKTASYYFDKLKNCKTVKLPLINEGAVYLRFNILMNGSQDILHKGKVKKIILGNWYRYIIDPKGVDYVKIGYEKGSCPKAEGIAASSVNLPTYIRLNNYNLNIIVDFISHA